MCTSFSPASQISQLAKLLLTTCGHDSGVLRGLYAPIKAFMRSAFKLHRTDLRDKRKASIDDVLKRVDAAVGPDGKGYIIGEELTYVDITFVSLVATLLPSRFLFKEHADPIYVPLGAPSCSMLNVCRILAVGRRADSALLRTLVSEISRRCCRQNSRSNWLPPVPTLSCMTQLLAGV